MSAPLFAQAGGTVVRVALPVPVDSLFDYQVPQELEPAARPGCRVLVPFSGRSLTGVIVERGDATSEGVGPLSRVIKVIDDEPALSPSLLGVLREAAAAVLCPVGLALATALPAGSAPRIVRELEPTRRGALALESGAVREAARDVLAALARRPMSLVSLTRTFRPALPASEIRARVDALLRDGLVGWREVERGPRVRTRRIREARVAPDVELEATCRGALARAPKQAALLRRVAAANPLATATLAGESGLAALLRALEKRGLVEIREREAPRSVGPAVARDARLPLTAEQTAALTPIWEAIETRSGETFLLHGVTGSGKTEVYLRAIEHALERGRQALVLVPEITLTHQIVARLRARFGDRLAVLHSGLRPSERLEQWQRLRDGETPIAVGARSALFAPLEQLGVIVVDEEHDDAYKNDEGFRYHARDLARRRAEVAGCPLVLGSATPAIETRHAAERGHMRRLTLDRRIGGRPLPAVEIVDMTAERARAPRGRKLILSSALRRAVKETLEDGAQTILFLNRRGFSTQIFCFDCGHAERCVDCDVALVYHAAENKLRCHYCDHCRPPPEQCGGCGALDTALLGVGTERLEEEVRSRFPEARIGRLDRDTAARRGHTESVLRGLRERELDILIGTQMVAKGHDFPGVRTVGVVAADLGLHIPDFRAAERTFQLLTQVAGRAGRAGTPGRVVVQSFVPEHYAIRPVVRHDYESFYAEELQYRTALGYPPLGGLAQLMVAGPDETATQETARRLADTVSERARRRGVELLGPAPAALARLRGRYRMQLLLKSKDTGAVFETARELSALCARLPREISAVVDCNPVNML